MNVSTLRCTQILDFIEVRNVLRKVGEGDRNAYTTQTRWVTAWAYFGKHFQGFWQLICTRAIISNKSESFGEGEHTSFPFYCDQVFSRFPLFM